jgi:hypothetical protein
MGYLGVEAFAIHAEECRLKLNYVASKAVHD